MSLERYFAVRPKRVGILMLDGAVDMYANLLGYVSFDLRRQGADVTLLGCNGGLKACTSLRSHFQGSPLDAQQVVDICGRCRAAQRDVGATNRIQFEPQINKEDEQLLAAIATQLEGSETLGPLVNGTLCEGICKIGFFDFSVIQKVNLSTPLGAAQKASYLEVVSDLVALRRHFIRLVEKKDLDAVLYVNGNYSQHQLAHKVFERYSIPCFSIEPQLTSCSVRNALMLVPERLKLSPTALATIDDRRPLASREVRRTLAHFLARIAGNEFNAYTTLSQSHSSLSTVGQLRDFTARHREVRTLFLSSEDELHAHEIVFDGGVEDGHEYSQYAAVKRFLAEADKCPEVGFIVRLHPRMAANKRNRFVSAEHARYVDLLSGPNVPKNVLALHGDCPISSYFLASKSSLVVVTWSTIGLEALLLGRPTIALFPQKLMYPIAVFNEQPLEMDEIFKKIFSQSVDVPVHSLPLLHWTTYAYEQQFSVVPVPRGFGRSFISRVYAGLFHRAKRSVFLILWYHIDGTIIRLQRRMFSGTASEPLESMLLDRYRKATAMLFRRYGNGIGL